MSFLSGILYRLSGHGNPPGALNPHWYYNRWLRRIGCSFLTALSGFIISPFSVTLICMSILHWFLLIPANCTYFKKLGGDHDAAGSKEWALTGFFLALCAVPLAVAGVIWWVIVLRIIFLAVTTCIWRTVMTQATWNERGAGFLMTASMILFLIGS